jgi:hypothetical protein
MKTGTVNLVGFCDNGDGWEKPPACAGLLAAVQ